METGDISQRKTSRDLKYIAKYLLGNGFSEDYTISYLIDFMNNYNNSGSRWKNTIVGIVKDIKKQNNYFLRDIDDIRLFVGQTDSKELPLQKNYIRIF